MNTIENAVKQGKQDYKNSPQIYRDEDQAIFFAVSRLLWEQVNKNEATVELINYISKLVER
jgi:hypothetical protein